MSKLLDVGEDIPHVQHRGHACIEQGIQVSLVAQHVHVLPIPAAHEVHVHVRKAWHKRPTVGVDDVGASRHQNRLSWAHYLDHGAANHHHGIWNWFTSVPIYQDGMCDGRNLLSTRWRSYYQNDKGRNPN